ncbi:hypothetical protein WR25_22356 [Diploscapter pachys]|uniref:Carboxypeptidase n=1 Tax=Diploscapter pachys TaxID=2018661 RepID=A0A2A2KJ45_9BILA|nr:hypothetical protein WR25_22356 [Diploscapter pachys]
MLSVTPIYHDILLARWQKVKKECCNDDIDDCDFHKYFEDSISYCGEFVDLVTVQQWEGGVNPYNIYANCDGILADSKRKNIKRRKDDEAPYPSVASLDLPCLDETAPTTYFNRQDVRKAMFIPASLGKWNSCSNEIGTFYRQEYRDMSSRVKNAVNAGLKVMLYHGDIDTVCNTMLGEKFTRALGFPDYGSLKF